MRRPALLWVSISIASCSIPSGGSGTGRPVQEIHSTSPHRIRWEENASPLRAKQTLPVLSPPEVFAVYVPSHVDRERDLMVGEHWVFFKLRESRWFAEAELLDDPVSSGPATPQDTDRLPRLKEEHWKKILIPYKTRDP